MLIASELFVFQLLNSIEVVGSFFIIINNYAKLLEILPSIIFNVAFFHNNIIIRDHIDIFFILCTPKIIKLTLILKLKKCVYHRRGMN